MVEDHEARALVLKMENKLLKTGTTTMGIICKDAVILATESQATMGYYVASKEATKLYKVSDNVGITISGGVADCQQIIRNLQALIKLRMLDLNRKISVRSITQLTSVILFQNRMFPYMSMLLIGGFDDTGPHLYSLDPFGSLLEEKGFASVGSGSVVGIGVLESKYKENLTVEEGIDLVKRAIDAARKRDTASGGHIQVAVITKEGFKLQEIKE
ncbi:MAG: archaeal proteasome endopeptidase complex subunit beta [Candidatus Helarchaeota archaeon]